MSVLPIKLYSLRIKVFIVRKYNTYKSLNFTEAISA